MSQETKALKERSRKLQRRARQSRRLRMPFYPTLQDKNGAPEDDRDTPDPLCSPGVANDRHLSDFENWGSE